MTLMKCIKSNLPVSSASESVEVEITDDDQVNPFVEPSSSIITKKIPKRRCHQCPRKHDRKFGTVCHLCNFNICNEHSNQFHICTSCSDFFILVIDVIVNNIIHLNFLLNYFFF